MVQTHQIAPKTPSKQCPYYNMPMQLGGGGGLGPVPWRFGPFLLQGGEGQTHFGGVWAVAKMCWLRSKLQLELTISHGISMPWGALFLLFR